MTMPRQCLRLAGSPDDLFSHMALWGLAAICADAGVAGVRGSWSNEPISVPLLWSQTEDEDVAAAVLDHVRRRAASGSWLSETFALGGSEGKPGTIATMAPRTASPASPDVWRELDAEAARIERELPSQLDEAMIQGLGYRSWWTAEGVKMRPDRGCSGWEMRTRNKGTDVVADRLLPLTQELATWSAQDILESLTGARVHDAVGKNAPESRSSTGFRLPGPADNARAWCALWGLSLLPVLPDRAKGGHTPALAPRNSVSTSPLHHLLMVVPSEPMPLSRFRRLQTSKQIVTAATDMVDRDTAREPWERVSALRWLRDRGATALLRFPVRYVGSTTAPERQALSGEVVRP